MLGSVLCPVLRYISGLLLGVVGCGVLKIGEWGLDVGDVVVLMVVGVVVVVVMG